MRFSLKNFDVLDEVVFIKDLAYDEIWIRGIIHSVNRTAMYDDGVILYGVVPYVNGKLNYDNILIRSNLEIKRMLTLDDIDVMTKL